MKKNDFVQIKGLDIKELMSKAKELKLEISNLVMDKNMKKTKDLKTVSKKRKDLAQVLTIARRIKLARQLNHFICPTNGCMKCRPLERVLKSEGEKVGVSDTKQDIYILP